MRRLTHFIAIIIVFNIISHSQTVVWGTQPDFSNTSIVATRAKAQSNPIVLTEFMASNSNTVADEDGDFSDWIEIHNNGATAVNLQGYTLSDNANELDKWALPASLLNANEYLIIFASSKNRAVVGNELHTNFNLKAIGEYLALTRPDGTIATQFSPQYPSIGSDVSYGTNPSGQPGILANPSPGFPNNFVGSALLSISPASQTFVESIQVAINSQVDGATIRYTTDGSLPTSSSPQYNQPLIFNSRTKLQVQAFNGDIAIGQIETQSYIQLENDAAAFTSDLPLIIIDTFDQTIDEASKVAVSAQFIDVGNNGQAAMIDSPQLATSVGLKIRGALSTSWDKKQYEVEIWDENQVEIDASPLGLPAESDWIINGPYADKTLMKNALVFGWWNQMGRYASRTRFVEVYLNEDNATISNNDYIGVYVLLERIKRSEDRVDIEKLTPTDTTAPAINGGYIWKIDDPPGTEPGFQSSQLTPSCLLYFNVYPRYENANAEQIDAMRGIVNQYDDALFSLNFTDPINGYARYIDVESFIDYGLMQDFTQNTDGYHRSIFFHKSRGGKVAMGPIWDFNFSLGVDNRGLGAPNQPVTDREGGSCWHRTFPRLFEDPEFEVKYWDRWFELRETVFEKSKLLAEIDANAAILNQAQARNFQRWDVLNVDIRDVTLPITYAGAITLLKDWVTARVDWFDSRWVNPPLFNLEGGAAAVGFQLSMSQTQNIVGPIYYTLDGRDPREVGGNIASGAIEYAGPVTLNNTTRVMARIKLNNGWSALNDDIFNIDMPASAGNLAIAEIEYFPHAATASEIAAGYSDADRFEFIELQNTSNAVIDISNVQLVDAVTFDFSKSDYLLLQPGERVLIVENIDAFTTRYDSNLPVAGAYSGKLSNNGEQITILDQQRNVIEQLFYAADNSWPQRAAGRGSSLVRKNVSIDGNLSDNWQSSHRYGGTPGEAAEEASKTVVFNEILAHTDLPLTDAIELYNDTANPVDISQWYLSDSSNNYRKYRIPVGTTLGAGSTIYFDESTINNPADVNALEPFALNSSQGEDLYLIEADSEDKLIRFTDKVTFGATVNGESIGRWPNGADNFYPMQIRTLGASNFNNGNRVRVGSIVLSEIHYNPAGGDTNLEYIELYNAGTETQSLDNWMLRGEVDFDFPAGVTLVPGKALIVVGFDPVDAAVANNFRNTWYDFGAINMFGPWTDNGQIGVTLNNSGGTIKLLRAGEPEIATNGSTVTYPMVEEETVRYNSDGRWASESNSGGPSLERINTALYADTPINWQPSTLDGGTPGVVLFPRIIVIVPTGGLVTTETGGADTFDIALQSPPESAVTIPLTVSDETEGSVSPAQVVFDASNWDQLQVVTITGKDDAQADGDIQYMIQIGPASSADGQYNNLEAADVQALNQSNDAATATSTATNTATSTATHTPRPTNTPVPVTTNTPVPLPSSTDAPTAEFTPTPRATNTPVPIATNTSVPLATQIPTETPTVPPVEKNTATPLPAVTAIATPQPVTPTPVVPPTPVSTPQPGDVTVTSQLIENRALVTWEYAADRKTLWFYIHRSLTNNFDDAELVTIDFIPAHFAGTNAYQIEDQSLSEVGSYHYWVEQVYSRSESVIHGPTAPIIVGGADSNSIYMPIIANQ